MKNNITLIVLLINLFNLTQAMEKSSMHIDSPIDDTAYQSIDVEQKKQAILEIFKSYAESHQFVDLFSDLLNIFIGSDFNNISSTPFRMELLSFIKEQCKNFYKLSNKASSSLTEYLQISLDRACEKINLLDYDDKIIDEIIYLIISGANPNVKIKTSEYGEAQRLPLLHFLILKADSWGYSEDQDCERKFKALISCLLICGVNVNYSSNKIESPLFLAGSFTETLPEIIKALIVFGANVNEVNSYGATILSNFVSDTLGRNEETRRLGIDLIKLLFAYGYQINEIKHDGRLFLINCYKEALELLIQYGFDINVQDKNGYTILYLAVQLQDVEFVHTLLKNGIDINLTDIYGSKAYNHIAGDSEKARQIKELFKQYQFEDTNSKDKSAITEISNTEYSNDSAMIDVSSQISESDLDQFTKYIHTLNEDDIVQFINSLNGDL